MIASKELAEALGNILPYVVTSVVDCRGKDCDEPCCSECYGAEKAKDEAGIAARALSASRKVLRQWKEENL